MRRVLWIAIQGLAMLALFSALLVALFRWLPPPTSAFMLQRHVEDWRVDHDFIAHHYQWVPYDAISPHMALAVVAAEDQIFPAHLGFDFRAIGQALEHNSHGGSMRGASTISQQVAKNLFLWPGRSYTRKALEAWFTLLIETFWPKQRILEVYLNIAEFGDHIYGVQAASRHFFKQSADHLSPRQAALLAAVLPNPRSFKANAPSPYVYQRQRWIRRQMRNLGGPGYLEGL